MSKKERAMKRQIEKVGSVAGLIGAVCGLVLAVYKVKETFSRK